MTKKKTDFGPDFGPIGPNLGPTEFLGFLPVPDVRLQCKLSLYALSRKTYDPNSRNWQKKLIFGLI